MSSDTGEGKNDDIVAQPILDSNQENALATKGRVTRGRPKSAPTRATRTKTAVQRLSGNSAITKKKSGPRKKAVAKNTTLKEQTNDQHSGSVEDVAGPKGGLEHGSKNDDDAISMDELDAKEAPVEQPAKPGRRTRKQPELEPEPEPEPEPEISVVNIENDGEFEYTPTVARQGMLSQKASLAQQAEAGKSNPLAEHRYAQKTIPDTQDVQMDLDGSHFPGEDDSLDEAIPQLGFQRSSNKRSSSRQPRPLLSRKRMGSNSDVEKIVNNSSTQQRLSNMTKKYEELENQYKKLRDVGIKQAEANFEKLKVQSETRSNAANELILSLKRDLATQTTIARESRSFQKQLATSENALSQAQAQLTQISDALTEAQNENKALQAKLANSRSASVAVESVNARTPGSGIRSKGASRTIMVGSAEAAQAAQVALLKEDLYSDLTGLILRGVDRGDEADIYDCIQTGRNGTLHFKLAVANDTDAKIPYEETKFTYTPRLDNNRDRDLLELLPDYLSEEIAFSRVNAAKFYGRVVETLTKKRADGYGDGF